MCIRVVIVIRVHHTYSDGNNLYSNMCSDMCSNHACLALTTHTHHYTYCHTLTHCAFGCTVAMVQTTGPWWPRPIIRPSRSGVVWPRSLSSCSSRRAGPAGGHQPSFSNHRAFCLATCFVSGGVGGCCVRYQHSYNNHRMFCMVIHVGGCCVAAARRWGRCAGASLLLPRRRWRRR